MSRPGFALIPSMTEQDGDDLRSAAERFIARYGEKAPDEARRRAVELAEAGHAQAAAEWERIAELAGGLLARRAGRDDPLH